MDTGEEVVITPITSQFEDDDHIQCCFDLHLTLCGLRGTHDGSTWEEMTVHTDGTGCPPCDALCGTGYCPVGMSCEVWIDIRNEQAGLSKANEGK